MKLLPESALKASEVAANISEASGASAQVVVSGLQDSEAVVRGQAAFALGQLAEYCQPDINEHYKELLPGVFHVMHDPTPRVQQQACYALDAFCENLGELSCDASPNSWPHSATLLCSEGLL